MTGEIKESTSSILNKEDVLPDTSGTPVMALPECLSAQSTSGTLETQLDDKMAILTLDKPAGRKALLHRSKLWLSNREMKEIRGWEDVSEKKIKIDARGSKVLKSLITRPLMLISLLKWRLPKALFRRRKM